MTKIYATIDLSRIVGCSDQTILNYVKRGVLKPLQTQGGQHIFSETHVEIARAQYSKSSEGRRVKAG